MDAFIRTAVAAVCAALLSITSVAAQQKTFQNEQLEFGIGAARAGTQDNIQ